MNVICLSDVAWNFLWQRQHQLLSRFPKDCKILYVEPSFWKALVLRIINFCSHIKTPATNHNEIIVKSIPTIPFVDRSTAFRKINDSIIIHIMRSFVQKYDLSKSLLIIYNPRFSCVLGKLKESLSCYEIIDEKMEFEAIPQWLEINHEFLIRNANLITVSSNILHKRVSAERRNDTFLIGNGADISHFKRSMLDIEIPLDIRSIKNPILGYTGAIGEWFDFALLEYILKTLPNIEVVLIGWAFNKQRLTITRLRRTYPNLHFMGRRSYDLLPNYVKAFAACIIPFRVYKLTEAVNPTKLYEYLAAGKPVISTALPELAIYKQAIYVAKNYSEFLEFINKALFDKKNHGAERIEIASKHDWKDKVQRMLDIIDIYKRKTISK
ncbi:MAG: glycosyltransferase [Thermoproteota archaeon]|nr:glycosyltransferase [Thermoproteota archaeon]